MTHGEQAKLALLLALPAIVSQLLTIVMEYVDTAMVGHLGAAASASIGLVSTTTWLMGGMCSSIAGGFAVLVAHSIGANDNIHARRILKKALLFTLIVSGVICLIGVIISPYLPIWLGGNEDIIKDATIYFLIFSISIPIWELNYLMASMLRSVGNMIVPSVVNVCACLLNIVFNYIFIFSIGLGVLGAAIGTLCSIFLSALALTIYVVFFSKDLKLIRFILPNDDTENKPILRPALNIGIPMAIQHIAMCSAQIASTLIVAPLGTVAIAAHAFGITIEGLCYMPGYGIGDAATTLVGQSIGAKRYDLKHSFSYITLMLGVAFMTMMGIIMYVGVPYLMPLMTPDIAVQTLTVECLRIEAFAEPLYATSIVIFSIFVGAGQTKLPAAINLCSMWLIRLPLAWWLAQSWGLRGVWIAMCIELCIRGLIFLVKLINNTQYERNHQSRIRR